MNKDKRKGPSKPTPSLRNLIDEVLAQAPANPPPRMSSFPKSEYDKLCENLGGPADLGYQVKRSVFRRCCAEFPLSQVLPILLRFSSNEDLARRHWPWAAFAISQYKFETGERTKYGDDPSPTQIRDLLGSIERTAQNLRSALTTFQALAERLPDPGSPLRRAHLSWLNAFIAQAVDGHLSDEVNEDGSSLHVSQNRKCPSTIAQTGRDWSERDAHPRLRGFFLEIGGVRLRAFSRRIASICGHLRCEAT